MAVEIDLWLWPLDRPDAQTTALRAHLSPDEITRADRFVRQPHRDRFLVGRGRLREILGGYTGHAPKALRLQTTARKKPFLQDGPAFNLSHSGNWAALAVAPNHPDLPLGIDIEAHREIERDLPARFFSRAEQVSLGALPDTHWTLGFFHAWTRKEAIIKATGEGLHTELASFDVSLGPASSAALLRATPPMPAPENWALEDLALGPNITGAIAAITGGAPLSLRVKEGALPLTGAIS